MPSRTETAGLHRVWSAFDRPSVARLFGAAYGWLAQQLIRLGIRRGEDGWRMAARVYLAGEESKMGLAAFGLDPWRGARPAGTDPAADEARLVSQLARALGEQPELHWRLAVGRFATRAIRHQAVDIARARFADSGDLDQIAVELDPRASEDPAAALELDARREIERCLVQAYNETRLLAPRAAARALRRRLLVVAGRDPARRAFAERLIAATVVSFAPEAEDRFRLPEFGKRRHPGLGLVNAVARPSGNSGAFDLWLQVSHVPLDGQPVQEFLDGLRVSWGSLDRPSFPPSGTRYGPETILAEREGLACLQAFLDLSALAALRSELKGRHPGDPRGSISLGALLIWMLARQEPLRGKKFCLLVELPPHGSWPRTCGIACIRPERFFMPDGWSFDDEGFLAYAREFQELIELTRERSSGMWKLLEATAFLPPVVQRFNLALMPSFTAETIGTFGVSLVRNSEVLQIPYNPNYTDGVLGMGNMNLPSSSGDRVGCVSLKGPCARVEGLYHALLTALADCARALARS